MPGTLAQGLASLSESSPRGRNSRAVASPAEGSSYVSGPSGRGASKNISTQRIGSKSTWLW